jgi:hypothetical protein
MINPGEPNCPDPEPPSFPAPRYAEIAHAVVLPPPHNGYVLLWCARFCENLPQPISSGTIPPYEMFLWHPTSQSLSRLPQYSLGLVTPGTADLFCGGQGLDRFGNPVIFGGTDSLEGCTLAFPEDPTIMFGHKRVALFENDSSLRQWWINPVPPGEQAEMTRSRWYATWVRLPNGDILIAGHEGYPLSEGYPKTVLTRERGHTVDELGVPDWFDFDDTVKNFRNWRYWKDEPTEEGKCAKVDIELVGDVMIPNYTQMHVTRAGHVVALLARTGVPPANISTTAYLDFNACQFDLAGERERWKPDLPAWTVLPSNDGAPSVHIVNLTNPVSPLEVIYSLGGGSNESGCPGDTTNRVVRLSNPAPGVPWVIDQPMIHARNSCNALLGLDGAIYVIGGIDGSCTPVLAIERMRPPEVFQAGMVTGWMAMCALDLPRVYHSWAVLLEDGTLAIGGGTLPYPAYPFGPKASNHSVEIFRPPYLYEPLAPEIVDWPYEMPVLQPGGTFNIKAKLMGLGTGGEFRVALVAPSAVTHTVNNDQRYVMLRVNLAVLDPESGVTTIEVQVPTNRDAPAGVYMLTVVNPAGTPSRNVFDPPDPQADLLGGAWLRLEPEEI